VLRGHRRYALAALPLVAVTVILMLASSVVSTYSQFTGRIANLSNTAKTGTVGPLTETQNGTTCTASRGTQWQTCGIDKYSGGAITSGNSTTPVTVTLKNNGAVAGHLFLLPSACTDTLTGAGGALCGEVTVHVSCPSFTPPFTFTGTLNAFHSGRNPSNSSPATGYLVGTLGAGAPVTCTFTLMAANPITAQGTVSQPIAWRLVM
jgi:hypothetical protein